MGEPLMRYFEVLDQDFDTQVLVKLQERADIAELYSALARSYEADTVHTWQHDGSFAGFSFADDSKVDTDTFKKTGSLWIPKRASTTGKKVWKLIKELPPPVNPNDVLHTYGINWKIPTRGSHGDLMFACVVGQADKQGWFVKVPSRHFSEPDLEAHRVAGTTNAGRTISPLWQPPAAWVELSEWAFLDKFHEQACS